MNAIGLKEWLENHNISYTLRKDVCVIPGFGRCFIQEKYEHIFEQKIGDNGVSVPTFRPSENIDFLKGDEIYYILFPFGRRWYYVDIREPLSTQEFKELRYVGNPVENKVKCGYCPLGIHTGFELLNGSGMSADWCKKAKFLGFEHIGIADRNTLAATLSLQMSATDSGLGYVFGYSLSIRIDESTKVDAIVYSSTQEGFSNLLKIQKAVVVDNEVIKEITPIELMNCASGNVLVFGKFYGAWLSENEELLLDFINAFNGWVYFQVDISEYKADRVDSELLVSIKSYFDAFYCGKGGNNRGEIKYKHNLRPVLIQDVYYLDKEDSKTKIILNKVDTGVSHNQSDRQYMKTLDELYGEFRALFGDKYGDDVFYDMCESTLDIAECACAKYDLTENYAPKYDMTDKERAKYKTTHNMFIQLIEDGFKRLVPEGEDEKYRKRIEYEKYVIESTDNVDYALITWDELNWAQNNGILTGIGRGSAGGSLLLYLMGITCIDPLKYDLIFERFLLPERAGLAPAKTTKMCGEVESNKYIELQLENGRSYKFDCDAKFKIKRRESEIEVYADELLDGDDIIWDNRDLLFSLNEKGENVELNK